MDQVNYILVLLIALLCAVAAVAGLARRFAVSYPIVLVIFGLLCSLLPHVPRIPLPPSIVFLVILPPLLYIAAWQTSWREFRYNLVSISSLAVLLVFFTAIGVAYAAQWWLPGFDWRLGFLLGAVVSPTDAVAATSIARNVGMPQRIVDLLEGESLLNDATGLLALEFGVEMVVQGTAPTIARGLLEFAWLTLGGVLVGLAIGLAVTWLERWVDDGPVEIALSLIVPYAAYLAGDAVKASGVIAVVACGLFVSRRSSAFFSPGVRLQAIAVWDALEFLLNGLVFVLIGLQLPYVLAGIRGQSKVSLLGVWAGLLRHSGCAAPGVDVSGGAHRVVGPHTHFQTAVRQPSAQSSLRCGMDWHARRCRSRGGQFAAPHLKRWQPVPSTQLYHLPDLCAHPRHPRSPGTLTAVARA